MAVPLPDFPCSGRATWVRVGAFRSPQLWADSLWQGELKAWL